MDETTKLFSVGNTFRQVSDILYLLHDDMN